MSGQFLLRCSASFQSHELNDLHIWWVFFASPPIFPLNEILLEYGQMSDTKSSPYRHNNKTQKVIILWQQKTTPNRDNSPFNATMEKNLLLTASGQFLFLFFLQVVQNIPQAQHYSSSNLIAYIMVTYSALLANAAFLSCVLFGLNAISSSA